MNRKVTLEVKKIEVRATRYVNSNMKKGHGNRAVPLQSEILIQLSENNGSMVQEGLEEALEIRKSTLSGILDTMIKNGLVENTVSKKDQRSKVISLTGLGRAEFKKAEEDLQKVENRILEGADKKDVETFFRVVDRIRPKLKDNDE